MPKPISKRILSFLVFSLALLVVVDCRLPIKKLTNQISETTQDKRATCPNDCSGHGTCTPSGTCSCNQGFVGTDCSIAETAITSGHQVTGNVETYQWNYYSINIQYTGSSLSIMLNETNEGDCDIYVQTNALPTRINYYLRDISIKSNIYLTAANVQSGTWYIGIYGFSTCAYLLTAFVGGTCPNDCSGHGSCVSGNCVCNSGWSGTDCSTGFQDINFGATITGSVADYETVIYRVNLQSANFLSFLLNQTSDGDCDLYVRYGNVPSIWTWDYANVTLANTSTINIGDARAGYWYVGVYGFRGCSFRLVASNSNDCPNKCSNRGTCSGTVCACPTGFTGDYCQTMTAALQDSQVMTGYVEYNSWNYYTYQSNTQNNMVITISETEASGDCDLYVKNGVDPTRFNYDYQDIGISDVFNLTINNPGHNVWHLAVYGWAKCSYSISVTTSSSCPLGCSGHGQCSATGVCVCNSEWSGEACESHLSYLQNGILLSGQSVRYNQWNFYTISVSNTSALHIQMKEGSSVGLLWLYVSDDYPTLRDYFYADTATNKAIHRIDMEFQSDVTQTYTIGVYANPYSTEFGSNPVPYGLVAWAPTFN